jgi:hypothetical protein
LLEVNVTYKTLEVNEVPESKVIPASYNEPWKDQT